MSNTYFSLPFGLTVAVPEIRSSRIALLEAYVPGVQQLSVVPEKKDIVFDLSSIKGSVSDLDFCHALYSVARSALLERHYYSVHAACIASQSGEGVLIVGHSGTGKTSVALEFIQKEHGKMFSGNKTVVSFEDGLVAKAGTRIMTIRSADRERYSGIIEEGFSYGERLAFSLKEDGYEMSKSLSIRKIILIRLDDAKEETHQLSESTALHVLYPYFLDTVNADTILGEDMKIIAGIASQEVREFLARSLSERLKHVPVYFISGSSGYICEQIIAL